MREDTFVGQHRFRWAWAAGIFVLVLGLVYAWHEPIGGRGGGSTVGFAYGLVSMAGLLWLLWYGVRKRHSYGSSRVKLSTWLGAHVWIGLALLAVVPLHSGFRFGWTLPSLAYLLTALTGLSGILGAVAYVVLPARMRARREGVSLAGGLEQVESVSREIAELVKDRTAAFLRLSNAVDFAFEPSVSTIVLGRARPVPGRQTLAALLAGLPREEYEAGLELIGLTHRKTQLCNQLVDEAGVAARMRVWLYFHVPIAIGATCTALAHVFWILYYRQVLR